ncbi:hypothetical protein [Hyphomonas sp.]|uniref:hypothetical protein n=1 Tax=Hyphomonas sp. TaxID=87 RepID=UPI000C8C16E0|nr:hypothetical protein [Hyphomonas sp.]MAL42731.1 hypothetical protein [Hyphomonas sp.]
MGKLRKIGKKIKKGIKSLGKSIKKALGGKLGKVIGMIGLSMMMYGVASNLFANNPIFQRLQSKLPKMDSFATADVTSAAEVGANAVTEVSELAKGATTTKTIPLSEATYGQLDVGGKVAKVGVDAANKAFEFGSGAVDYVKELPSRIMDGSFVGDVAEGTAVGVLTNNLLAEDGDLTTFAKSPQAQAVVEPAQRMLVQDIQKQMPLTPINNFQDINNNLIFGTLAPSYLNYQFEQLARTG